MPFFGNLVLGVLEFTGREIAKRNFEDFPSPVIITKEKEGHIDYLSVEEIGQEMGGN